MRVAPDAPLLSRRDWLWLAVLCAAVFLAYQPAWRAGFIWDDPAHITRPDLRSLGGLARIWCEPGATQQYYPLLHSAFWLEHRVFGDAPAGYHLVNIALHALNAALLGLILRRLCVPGAALAVGLFALHPVMVESVAWVAELKNLLSGFFYFGAAIAYLRFDTERTLRWHAAAFVLFGLGLLSKTVIATLPGGLLVVLWWQRGRLEWRRDVKPLVPFFVLGVAGGLFTAWMERTKIGASGAAFDFSLIERGLIAGRALCFYAGKLLWPAELIFFYPRWSVSALVWWQYVFPLGVVVGLAALWRLRSRARGPLAGALFFAGTLFPALGFVNVFPFVFSFVADHFQYLASVGVIVPVAAGLDWAARRWLAPPVHLPAAALMLVVLGALTWRQSRDYRDAATLYRAVLARNPTCWIAHNNLGLLLAGAGERAEAIAHYREALRAKPDYGEAHFNLGSVALVDGRAAEAVAHLAMAARATPGDAETQNSLGVALMQAGRLAEAVRAFAEASQLRPNYAAARYNHGNALFQLGRVSEAAAQWEASLRFQPAQPLVHNNLGVALQQMGRSDDALAHYREALRLKPDYADARENLQQLEAALGRARR